MVGAAAKDTRGGRTSQCRRQDVTVGAPTALTACQGNRRTAAGYVMVVDDDRGRYLIAITTIIVIIITIMIITT